VIIEGTSIITYRDESRMTQAGVSRPFEEFDGGNQLRPEPAASLHVFGNQTLTPSAPSRFGKIPKRTFGDRQTFEIRKYRPTGSLREAVPNSACI